MASLPASPFSFAGKPLAETLVVVSGSQAPDAAISGPFEFGAPVACPPDETAASPGLQGSGAAAEYDSLMDCIGEIFAGARKLEQIPGLFDQAAYTPADELAYVELKLRDDPWAADLIAIPEGLWMEFDPPPLFIQEAMRA